MTCRIGINGLGRIGRMVLRRVMTLPDARSLPSMIWRVLGIWPIS